MSRYFCDLHIHSCLSPCAEDDMTPMNVAGMAMLCGVQIAALTDHNTSKNCPAFFAAAKKYGIIPVPGMELTTQEDIHVVCLFPTLEGAMDFDAFVSEHRPFIKNNPAISGRQLLIDENDEIVGEEENLLWQGADLSLEDAYGEVWRRGGVCFPAHIDRPGNGVIETLATFPDSPAYTCYELHDAEKGAELCGKFPILSGIIRIISSDAHRLTDMREKEFYLDIDDEPYSSDAVRKNLIKKLRKE